MNHAPTVSAENNIEAAFIPMTLINAGYDSRYSYETKKWCIIKTGFTKIAVGDIAYAKITPCFQNRKSFILGDVPGGVAAATTELNVLRIYGQTLNAWYILYFLKSDYFIKEAKYKGTAGQQRVLSTYVQNKLVPVPPYNEQYRIIEKIQKVLPIVDKYGKSQNILDKLNTYIFDKLKKSVLQDAIQGKLVPQLAEEGTAQELLKQIKQEKQRLVKEGKLKKSSLNDSVIFKGDDNKYYERIGKNITDITDEIPFEIPQNWQWTRLGDVVMINPRNSIDDKIEVGFIPMASIEAGYKSEFSYTYRKWGNVKSGFTHLADDDVAWAKITPCLQNRKSMILKNLPNGYAVGTTELNVLRSYNKTIIAEYLLWFCKSTYFIEEAIMKGTAGQQRVKVDYTPNKLFPLPPMEEQKRITVRIGQLFKILK